MGSGTLSPWMVSMNDVLDSRERQLGVQLHHKMKANACTNRRFAKVTDFITEACCGQYAPGLGLIEL